MRKFVSFLAVLGLVALATTVQAAIITPTSGILGVTRFEIASNSNLDADGWDALLPGDSPLFELYKQNVGGSESGVLAGSYITTFQPAVDPSGAIITYSGAGNVPNILGDVWLIVKDGSADPAQYAFLLSSPTVVPPTGWNGTETLNLVGFWPLQGAISHIAILGALEPRPPGDDPDPPGTVPEPGTLTIMGLLSMLGVGTTILRRKRGIV